MIYLYYEQIKHGFKREYIRGYMSTLNLVIWVAHIDLHAWFYCSNLVIQQTQLMLWATDSIPRSGCDSRSSPLTPPRTYVIHQIARKHSLIFSIWQISTDATGEASFSAGLGSQHQPQRGGISYSATTSQIPDYFQAKSCFVYQQREVASGLNHGWWFFMYVQYIYYISWQKAVGKLTIMSSGKGQEMPQQQKLHRGQKDN